MVLSSGPGMEEAEMIVIIIKVEKKPYENMLTLLTYSHRIHGTGICSYSTFC